MSETDPPPASPSSSFHDADPPTGASDAREVAPGTDASNARVTGIVRSFQDAQHAVRAIGATTDGVHALLVSMFDAERAFAILDPRQSPPRIAYASDALCKATGYASDELRDAPWSTFYGPETDLDATDRVGRCVRRGVPAAARVTHYRKSGTPFLCSIHVSPKFDGRNRVAFFLATMFDIAPGRSTDDAPDPGPTDLSRVPIVVERKRSADESSSDDIVRRGTIRVRNRIEEQLFLLVQRCATNRNLYWLMGYEFSRRERAFLIPALVFMTLASVFSAMQAAESSGRDGTPNVYYRFVEPYLILVFTLLGTVLSGVRAVYRYGERADECKSAGKMFGKIAARIDMTLDFLKTNDTDPCTDARLETFAREIMAQVDNVVQDAPDVPMEKLNRDVRMTRHGHLVSSDTIPRFIRKVKRGPKEKNVEDIV